MYFPGDIFHFCIFILYFSLSGIPWSLYPAPFTGPLSPGLREGKGVLPLGLKRGRFLGMVSSTEAWFYPQQCDWCHKSDCKWGRARAAFNS